MNGLSKLLTEYMSRVDIKDQRLRNLVNQRFPELAIHRSNIRNWRQGDSRTVRKWEQLAAIADVLNLSMDETNRLLMSGGHSDVEHLLENATPDQQIYLAKWSLVGETETSDDSISSTAASFEPSVARLNATVPPNPTMRVIGIVLVLFLVVVSGFWISGQMQAGQSLAIPAENTLQTTAIPKISTSESITNAPLSNNDTSIALEDPCYVGEVSQDLGNYPVWALALGDLDNDGDLDIFAGINSDADSRNQVWWNDGNGTFTPGFQTPTSNSTEGVAIGDIDGDGNMDLIEANSWGFQTSKTWINQGEGRFVDSGQPLSISYNTDVALGDLDADGDLDIFFTNWDGQPNEVWFNDGSGVFTDSGQALGDSWSLAVALGDVDGDKDLDAFVVNARQSNRIWLNDGKGNFTNDGRELDGSYSASIALGDLDMDGDLDAFIGDSEDNTTPAKPSMIWMNDGLGNLHDSGQQIGGTHHADRVALGDLDNDGDLDGFVVNSDADAPIEIWLNEGTGQFRHGIEITRGSPSRAVVLGDVNGDGYSDAIIGSDRGGLVWLNRYPTCQGGQEN